MELLRKSLVLSKLLNTLKKTDYFCKAGTQRYKTHQAVLIHTFAVESMLHKNLDKTQVKQRFIKVIYHSIKINLEDFNCILFVNKYLRCLLSMSIVL